MPPLNQLGEAVRGLPASDSPFTPEQAASLASLPTDEALSEALAADAQLEAAFRLALQVASFREALRDEHSRLAELVGPAGSHPPRPEPSAIPKAPLSWRHHLNEFLGNHPDWIVQDDAKTDRIMMETPDGPAEIYRVADFAVAYWPSIGRLAILFGAPPMSELESWIEFRLMREAATSLHWEPLSGADWETPLFTDGKRMALVAVDGQGALVVHVLNGVPDHSTELLVPDWAKTRLRFANAAGVAPFVGGEESRGADDLLKPAQLTGPFDFPALHQWLGEFPSPASDAIRAAMTGEITLAVSPTHLIGVSPGDKITAVRASATIGPDYLVDEPFDLATLLRVLADPARIDQMSVSFTRILWEEGGPRLQTRERRFEKVDVEQEPDEDSMSFVLRKLFAASPFLADSQVSAEPGEIDEGNVRVRPFRDMLPAIRRAGFSYVATHRAGFVFFINRNLGVLLVIAKENSVFGFYLFDVLPEPEEIRAWDEGAEPLPRLIPGRSLHAVLIEFGPTGGHAAEPAFTVPLSDVRERNPFYVDRLLGEGFQYLGGREDIAVFVSLRERRTVLLLGPNADSLVIVPSILRREEALRLPRFNRKIAPKPETEVPPNLRHMPQLLIGGLLLGSSFLPGCGRDTLPDWGYIAVGVAALGLAGLYVYASVRSLIDTARANDERNRQTIERAERALTEWRAQQEALREQAARQGEELRKAVEALVGGPSPPPATPVPERPPPLPVAEELVSRLVAIIDDFQRSFAARKVEDPMEVFRERLDAALRSLEVELRDKFPRHSPILRRYLTHLDRCRKTVNEEAGIGLMPPVDGTVQERYEALTFLSRWVALRLKQQIIWFADQEGVEHGLPPFSKGERELLDSAPSDSSPVRYFREADPLIRSIGIKINIISASDWCDPKWNNLLESFRAKLAPRSDDDTMNDYVDRLNGLAASLDRHMRILNDAEEKGSLDSELGKRARRSLAIILRTGKGRQLKETPAQERAVAVATSVSSVPTGKGATVLRLVVSRGPSQSQVPSGPPASPRGPGGTPPPTAASAQPALALSDSLPVMVEDQGDRIQIVRQETDFPAHTRALFREALRLLVETGRKKVAVTLARNPDRLTPSQLAQLILHLRSRVATQSSDGKSSIRSSGGSALPVFGLTAPLFASPSPVLLLK